MKLYARVCNKEPSARVVNGVAVLDPRLNPLPIDADLEAVAAMQFVIVKLPAPGIGIEPEPVFSLSHFALLS